jgi:type IV pilus assembly protein PilC
MAVFTYVAKDEKGATVTGTYTDVEGASALRDELDKIGYTLIKAKRNRTADRQHRRKGRVKQLEVAAFAYKFAGMYSAGLPILKCLDTIEQQTDKAAFRDIIADIKDKVSTGSGLKNAFARHKGIFSDFFLGMLDAGEVGSRLDDTLTMSASYLEKQAALKQKVQSAFAYPVIVSIMCCVVVGFLLTFVIPVFAKLYAQVKAPMPGPTLVLMSASAFIRHKWWLIAIVVTGLIVAVRKLLKNPRFRAAWDNFKLNVPIFGRLNRMIVISHWTRTLAMLTSVGVSVIKALEMADLVAHNYRITEITNELTRSIQAGASIAGSLKKYEVFPPVIVQMASSGEEVGELPSMLLKGADMLDKDIERTINSLLVKLEPALTLIMGLVVGFILIGAYLPMFDYMSHLK